MYMSMLLIPHTYPLSARAAVGCMRLWLLRGTVACVQLSHAVGRTCMISHTRQCANLINMMYCALAASLISQGFAVACTGGHRAVFTRQLFLVSLIVPVPSLTAVRDAV